MNEYPNSGKLANNRFKDNDKKPDMKGEISMQRSVLKQLMEEHDGDEIVIKLSGWRRQGNYGEFFSLKWDNYKKAEERPYSKPAAPADDSDVPF
jgi:hypothetical protein